MASGVSRHETNEHQPDGAELRFYAELNDFVAPERRYRTSTWPVPLRPAVKDVIEAAGVPHTEVDLVLVDGEPVGFDHRVAPGARIAVYPVFETLEVGPLQRLRPEPLRTPRFLLDVHLGRLARWLRLLGFDTAWEPDAEDGDLARRSADEHRILLTRDRGLLKRGEVTHGAHVAATDPEAQAVEIVRRFHLAERIRPFARCLACNGTLAPAAKAEVLDRLPPRTAREHDDFQRCRSCDRVYWRGSHHERLTSLVERVQTATRSATMGPRPRGERGP